MYSPVPNGEQHIGGVESEGGSADIDYADNSEDGSDDCDNSEQVESPPCTKRRTKQTQDPAASQGKVVVSSVRNQSALGRQLLTRLGKLPSKPRLLRPSHGWPYPG